MAGINDKTNSLNIEGSTLGLNLVDQLNLQLELLDDKEFGIPPVEELPTLESILNEEDEEEEGEDIGSTSDDENASSIRPKQSFLSVEGADVVSVRSRESSDTRSRHSTAAEHWRLPKRDGHSSNAQCGSILRHIALNGISVQLLSAHDRVGAGLPTAMSISKLICIGTSHGLILVFEPCQALRCCLGSKELGEQHGAVSALALNRDSSKLLVGFARGHLCLFDVANGKLLQNIPDAHTPSTSVLHIKWTDYPGLAVISDCGGSVFELSVRRTMGLNMNESQCIFSGSRGEVCAVEPLIMGHFLNLPPVIDTIIIAMATISKVIVVSLRPYLRVLFSHPLKGASTTLPLLNWQFVIIQMPDGAKVIDPVLAFARESTIHFFQLTHAALGNLTFIPLQRISLPYTLQAIAWINSRTMATICTQERLRAFDVKDQTELDEVDLGRLGLVYSSSHFKGISTGGNVSKAMAIAGDRACYNSIGTYGSQIFLLGTKSFQVVTMRTWLERVSYLTKKKRIKDALFWLLDVLHNKARAVIGLTHKKPRRLQLVRGKILELLKYYLEKSLSERPVTGSSQNMLAYFQNVVPPAVKVAVEGGFKELLFAQIWDTFSEETVSRGIFLECLEPYILNKEITEMPPTISQYFLSHYEDKGYLEALEACIVQLEITSLDLHQAMTLSRSHGLYDSIFYVHNRGMKDYISPLEELLMVLKKSLDANVILTDVQIALGNKILVYISCCLAGRAYPYGDIDLNEVKKVKHEVFNCLTSLHTHNAKENERPYPFLRTLLRFDTREFLNVLALAFEEKEFTSELGLIQRERVVDQLLQVMVNDEQFESSQIISLFIFISRQIGRKGIPVSRSLIDQVLDQLTTARADLYHEERETSLLELLEADALSDFKSLDIVAKAEKAEFYRVCEFMYEKSNDYEKILECYIKDRLRSRQVFSYICHLFSSNLTTHHKNVLKSQILFHVDSLIGIDAVELAKVLLFLSELRPLIKEIISKIKPKKELCLDFIQAILSVQSDFSAPNESTKATEVSEDDGVFQDVKELLIELMCVVHPSRVYNFLQSSKGYRLDIALEHCRNANLEEAVALLLERKGELEAAYEVHLKILKVKIENLLIQCDKKDNSINTQIALGDLKTTVNRIIHVCQSRSATIEEEKRKNMWFPFLDVILSIQPSLDHQNGLNKEIRSLVGLIVNSMVGHISLPKILEQIMQSPSYRDCSFGQIKHLLDDMVQRYMYEDTLYSATINIVRNDQLRFISEMKSLTSVPLSVTSTLCSICNGLYHPSTKAVVHGCGHSYHVFCGGEGEECLVCGGSPRSMENGVESHDSESESTEQTVTMDKMQLDGLKRVSVLDTNAARFLLWDDLRSGKKSTMSHDTEDAFSQSLILNLSPRNLTYESDDI